LAAVSRFIERRHLAASLEVHAAIDEDGGRVEGARDLGRRVEFDGVARKDVRLDLAARDDARRHVDLARDEGALADDEHVLPADLAAEAPVDADAALEEELALEVRPLAEQRRDLGRPPGRWPLLVGRARRALPGAGALARVRRRFHRSTYRS